MARVKSKAKPNGFLDPQLIERAQAFRKQKALGQCFLVSSLVLEDIASFTLSPVENPDTEGDLVFEIGAGIGFLTEKLLPQVRKLYAVELDTSCMPFLKLLQAADPKLEVLRGDVLQTQLADCVGKELAAQILKGEEEKIKVIANIPYQISSRIIVHLLGEIGDDLTETKTTNRHLISEINILVQKEFADRLCAKPGVKDHGALTLLVNYWAEVERLFDVPRSMFMPEPKVDSTLVCIKLRDKPAVDLSKLGIDKPAQKLRRLIKTIYSNRRKTMNNALKAGGYDGEIISSLNLGNLRGETLDLEGLLPLVKAFG